MKKDIVIGVIITLIMAVIVKYIDFKSFDFIEEKSILFNVQDIIICLCGFLFGMCGAIIGLQKNINKIADYMYNIKRIKFNMESIFEFIERIIKIDLGIEEGINDIVRYCHEHYDIKIWEKFKNIDFKNDVFNCKEWLENILDNENLEDVRTLYFQLFVLESRKKRETAIKCIGINENYNNKKFLYNKNYFQFDDNYITSEFLNGITDILKNEKRVVVLQLAKDVVYLAYSAVLINEILGKMDIKY